MTTQEISMIVSSDPSQGASNVSQDGSSFQINLDADGLQIPKEANNCQVRVDQASVWWSIPNIITGQNDKLYITAPNVLDQSTNYVITISQGLYDLPMLNLTIQRELQNQQAKISPKPVISLVADDATQKVGILRNYTDISIDFTQLDTFRQILGFNSQTISANATAPLTTIADNTASFNTLNYFLIGSDIVSKGIRFNSEYNQTIAQVLVDVAPGSQIVYQPFNPARCDASNLIGSKRTSLRFFLTDDKNRRVNTAGEYWSARIVISYTV
jgi:hypothetical protein